LTFFVFLAFLFEWLERKTSAKFQGRVGPLITGPYGILQPVADYFKLIYKEEIIPKYSDKFVFRFAPPLFFSAPAIGIIFIPVLSDKAILSHKFDLLFILFVLAFSILMASILGYSSAGRYSTIAIGRLILQYTSYEIPLIISVITPAIIANSLSIQDIVLAQKDLWFIFIAPLSFATFIISSLAELEKPPFDIPSAKTEIVAGWMTEFSGRALAYVKLTKNLSYVFLSAIAVSLFLAGPLGPIPIEEPILSSTLHLTYFLLKLFIIGFLIFAIRTALARIKINQATQLFWLIITPLSFIQLGIVIALR